MTATPPSALPRVVHGLCQPGHAFAAVHRDAQLPAFGRQPVRQLRHAGQLVRRDDLVGDVDVVHAAGRHGLGLGRLLHADADRAGLHLQPAQGRALVHLGVRRASGWRASS
jgi:hypothetical protein